MGSTGPDTRYFLYLCSLGGTASPPGKNLRCLAVQEWIGGTASPPGKNLHAGKLRMIVRRAAAPPTNKGKQMGKYLSHYRALVHLGTPLIIGQIGVVLQNFADTLMIGHHTTVELAAASLVSNIFILGLLMAMGFALCSAFCFKKGSGRKMTAYTVLIVIWALLVGISRIFVGKHFLGDVLVGFAVGALVGWAVASLAFVIRTSR